LSGKILHIFKFRAPRTEYQADTYQHYSSTNQLAIAAVELYFADITKNHYRNGILALELRWNKCISFKGDYVKK
jgi:hypothetical protein